MRLLRYGPPGREKPGMADADGNIRDLSKVITQIDDNTLAPRNLARLTRVKPETLPIVRIQPDRKYKRNLPRMWNGGQSREALLIAPRPGALRIRGGCTDRGHR